MYLALTTLALLSVTQTDVTATDALKGRDAEIRAALPPSGSTSNPDVRKKLEIILTRLVDLEGMAKAVLPKVYDEQPEAKQRAFLDAFVTAFRRALLSGELEFYRQATTTFGEEQKEGEDVRVPTTLVVKDEPTSIEYKMRKDKSGWRILDITIDDVSTVENYRASFGRIVAKEGFDSLINRLQKKKT